MGRISLRLPDHLHDMVRQLAEAEQSSVNQLITLTVSQKIAALKSVAYLEGRANRGDRARFDTILAKVPDAEPNR